MVAHCVKSVQIRSFPGSYFAVVWTEYGDLLHKSPYSVRIRENTDQEKLRICRPFKQWLVLRSNIRNWWLRKYFIFENLDVINFFKLAKWDVASNWNFSKNFCIILFGICFSFLFCLKLWNFFAEHLFGFIVLL